MSRTAAEVLDHISKLRNQHAELSRQLSERLLLEAAFPELEGAGVVETYFKGVVNDVQVAQQRCFDETQSPREAAGKITFYVSAPEKGITLELPLTEIPEPFFPVACKQMKCDPDILRPRKHTAQP